MAPIFPYDNLPINTPHSVCIVALIITAIAIPFLCLAAATAHYSGFMSQNILKHPQNIVVIQPVLRVVDPSIPGSFQWEQLYHLSIEMKALGRHKRDGSACGLKNFQTACPCVTAPKYPFFI